MLEDSLFWTSREREADEITCNLKAAKGINPPSIPMHYFGVQLYRRI